MRLFDKNSFFIFSGSCSFESISQLESQIKTCNTKLIRLGIFKLRTQKNSFQGHGLNLNKSIINELIRLKKDHNLTYISEIVDEESVDFLADFVDIFQVGTRNMYNYQLLKFLNNYPHPVLLKRAFSATIKEWLYAADYIEDSIKRVILCERGIRTFENSYRNTLDINAALTIKKETPYRIIIDPSHGCGRSDFIKELALASYIIGADGLMIETHSNPFEAISDKKQTISHDTFNAIIESIKKINSFRSKDILY